MWETRLPPDTRPRSPPGRGTELCRKPETITRCGRTTVVVVSFEEWERKTRRSSNPADFRGLCLRNSAPEIECLQDDPRENSLCVFLLDAGGR